MKSILFFLSCFFILAVGCSPEDATAPSKQINGSLFVTVQDPSGKPVAEFGGPGGYIRGSFSGKIDKGGNGSGGPSPSDFSGTFSVKND